MKPAYPKFNECFQLVLKSLPGRAARPCAAARWVRGFAPAGSPRSFQGAGVTARCAVSFERPLRPARRGREGGLRLAGQRELMTDRQIMTGDEIRRAIVRISHEIVEKQAGTQGLALVGSSAAAFLSPAHRRRDRGARGCRGSRRRARHHLLPRRPVARRPAADRQRHGPSFDLNGTTIVLVDDVLYTGRTIRAAMDALIDFGRPGRSGWRCSSTAATASCRSARTTSARTFPRRVRRSSRST